MYGKKAVMVHPNQNPELSQNKLDLLRQATKGLSQRERVILISYYYENKTLQEIGDELNISQPRICEIHQNIQQHLRLQTL